MSRSRVPSTVVIVAAAWALAGCEAKLHCDVRTQTDTVGDEERTVFVVVNRGAEPILGATLEVDGEITPEGGAAAPGIFTAEVREVVAGGETKIATSLLRKAGGEERLDGKLTATKSVRLLVKGKAACESAAR